MIGRCTKLEDWPSKIYLITRKHGRSKSWQHSTSGIDSDDENDIKSSTSKNKGKQKLKYKQSSHALEHCESSPDDGIAI